MSNLTYVIASDAPREKWADLCRAIERGEWWTPRTPVRGGPAPMIPSQPLRPAPFDRLRNLLRRTPV